MKYLKSIMIALVLSFALVFSANAMMNDFEIADINLDTKPEIVVLEGAILTVYDDQGTVLFTKTIQEISDIYINMPMMSRLLQNRQKTTGGMMGGGMMGGGGNGTTTTMTPGGGGMMGGGGNGGTTTTTPGGGGMMGGGVMMGNVRMMGSIGLEIANMDETPNPEIVIRVGDTLIVMDNTLTTQFTIKLADPNNQ